MFERSKQVEYFASFINGMSRTLMGNKLFFGITQMVCVLFLKKLYYMSLNAI